MSGPSRPAGMSLYADLLEPERKNTGSVIASAPVRYNMKPDEPEVEMGKKKDGAYQIPAYLRPQIQHKKTKPTQPPKNLSDIVPSSSPARPDASIAKPPTITQKSRLEDWVGHEDEEVIYQRPSRNRQNKNKKKKEQSRIWSWDDIYDPSLPNNYADYKGSDEQFAEIRDWKARLYYHQLKEIDREDRAKGKSVRNEGKKNPMFAPPAGLNFAPPSFEDRPRRLSNESSDDEYDMPHAREDAKPPTSVQPVVFAPSSSSIYVLAELSTVAPSELSGVRPLVDQTADTALRQSPMGHPPLQPMVEDTADAPLERTLMNHAPLVAPVVDEDFKITAMAKAAAIKARLNASIKAAKEAAPLPIVSTPVQTDAQVVHAPVESVSEPPDETVHSTISRAPVRYSQAPAEEPAPAPVSSRPGQKNFAERYMQKFGYEKGKGLGAQGEGIVTPIIMKAEKRKKRSDAEGGGWAVPANMGKIVGGKKRKFEDAEDEADMSAVIKIPDMISGLDIDYEMQERDLMQRIGDTLSQSHGNIERIFIWRQAVGGDDAVFVKFNSAVSALGAVNRPGGIAFAGNSVQAAFYDAEKFDRGEYA